MYDDNIEVVYVCPRLDKYTGEVVLCIPEPSDIGGVYATSWTMVDQHSAAAWGYFKERTTIATYEEAIGVIGSYAHYYGVQVQIIPDLETAFERFLQVRGK